MPNGVCVFYFTGSAALLGPRASLPASFLFPAAMPPAVRKGSALPVRLSRGLRLRLRQLLRKAACSFHEQPTSTPPFFFKFIQNNFFFRTFRVFRRQNFLKFTFFSS